MKYAIASLALGLSACVHVEKNSFGPGVDPQWAARVYELCEAEHGANVHAYNQCLEDYARYD